MNKFTTEEDEKSVEIVSKYSFLHDPQNNVHKNLNIKQRY